MGFLDSLGNALGQAAKEKMDEFKKADNAADDMTDSQLFKGVKDSDLSMTKRMAYALELKKRGYGND